MTPERVATAFVALSGEAVLEARRLSGGSGLPSWQVTTAANTYAARLYADEHPSYGQARLLSYLRQHGFPVPEVALVGTYQAQHLLALSWVEGLTVADALRAEPARSEQLGRTFGEVHARLHAVLVPPEIRAVLRVVTSEQSTGTPVLVHLD